MASQVAKLKWKALTFAHLRVYRTLYLATPYTKFPAGINTAFEEAARLGGRLTANGVNVFSPIAMSHPYALMASLNPLDHSIWIPLNEAMMRACEAMVVAQMEGWRDSDGIAREIRIFQDDRKPIFLIQPNSLEVREYSKDA